MGRKAVLSKASRMDLETGSIHTVCPKGHKFEVTPVRWDPDFREGLYGSDQDFCGVCGESLNHEIPEWKLNKQVPLHYLEVEGGAYEVRLEGNRLWTLSLVGASTGGVRLYYGYYPDQVAAMEAVNELPSP